MISTPSLYNGIVILTHYPATTPCYVSSDYKTLHCQGDWTFPHLRVIEDCLQQLRSQSRRITTIDVSAIKQLDSAGVLLLQNYLKKLSVHGRKVKLTGVSANLADMFKFLSPELEKIERPLPPITHHNWFYRVGHWAVDKYTQTVDFLAFVGELASTFLQACFQPWRFHLRSIVGTIETAGYQALPIVALMSFLIGIVLAYQLITQLQAYGADIYVVDVTGIGILREFAPLITAVIIAGRTSTSFAALIGTMKVNEEIDALAAMGVSPIERLVLPRIIGLLIALPLLVVWADIFGIFGSMVMTKNMLGIGFHGFMARFFYAVEMKHYFLGLVKTPAFAIIIATVGCFQGFEVTMSAESVGQKTTKAAVQAIFLIIVADAAFSVLFSKMGL